MNSDGDRTNSVNLVDVDTMESCLHSELPIPLKEAHVFEFQGTILLCTSSTDNYGKKLQCFKWSDGNWETFPVDDDVFGTKMKFISAVSVPNMGIWFMGATSNGKSGVSVIVDENGEWKNGPKWTRIRQRACSVLLSDTKVAHIGGEKSSTQSAKIGNTIDMFDVDPDLDNPTETWPVDVQMGWERKHLSCALIPKGLDGHPTVAICKLIYESIVDKSNYHMHIKC